MLDVFVQVLGVLTVGRRTGGAGVEPGWVWSRSVPVEPQDSSGAVVLCLHNGVGGSWIRGYVLGSCCDTSVLSTNRRKHPFYINEIYIKPCVSVGCREYRVCRCSTFSSELLGNSRSERLRPADNELIWSVVGSWSEVSTGVERY